MTVIDTRSRAAVLTPSPAKARFGLRVDRSTVWAHRSALVLALAGLEGVVSASSGGAPALWDRRTHRIVSDDVTTLDARLAGLADRFGSGVRLYPAGLRQEIDELELWLGPERDRVPGVLAVLDRTFRHSRYLLGDRLTLADVRLFVTLVRHDTGPRLEDYPELWAYARELYQRTEFRSFPFPVAPGADWEAPVARDPEFA